MHCIIRGALCFCKGCAGLTRVMVARGASTHISYSTVATAWSKMWPLRQWKVHCCPSGALYVTWMYQKGSAM